jgi:hypothetical protein
MGVAVFGEPASGLDFRPNSTAPPVRRISLRPEFHVPVRGSERAAGAAGLPVFHSFFIRFPLSGAPNRCAFMNSHAFWAVEHEGTT